MRWIDEIIVHCSYTKADMDIGVDWIRNIHVNEKGFNDIGYHYVIKRNGDFDHGRKLELEGAHCYGHNKHSIGICLVGGMSDDNQPEDNFTPEQFQRLREMIEILRMQFPDIDKISGHSEYANKACPCFDVLQKLQAM